MFEEFVKGQITLKLNQIATFCVQKLRFHTPNNICEC